MKSDDDLWQLIEGLNDLACEIADENLRLLRTTAKYYSEENKEEWK